MNAAHTPGPWKKRKGFEDGTIEIFKSEKAIKKPAYPTEIAVVHADDKEGKANARLIAEAPTIRAERDELLRDRLLLGVENIALRDKQADMLAALIVAREWISHERKIYADCNTPPNGDRLDPYDRYLLEGYDAALLQIDAAIAKATGGAVTGSEFAPDVVIENDGGLDDLRLAVEWALRAGVAA
jgi:hypothetical protein